MTTLHAGGKFDSQAYKVSGGLHGVGVSCVNALSEWLEVKVRRNDNEYYQKYDHGIPIASLKIIGKSDKTGTTVTFSPDSEIFETTFFRYETIATRLKELAFLNGGLNIEITLAKVKQPRRFSGAIILMLEEIDWNIAQNSSIALDNS